MYYISNLLFTYNIIKANIIGSLIITKFIILLSKKNIEFDIINY